MVRTWLSRNRQSDRTTGIESVFEELDASEAETKEALLEVLYSKARLRGEQSRQRVLAARNLTAHRREILIDLEEELRCVRELEQALIDRLKSLRRHRVEAEAVERLDRSAQLRRSTKTKLEQRGVDELIERLRDLREQRTIERELEAL